MRKPLTCGDSRSAGRRCRPITPRSWGRWPSALRTQRSSFDLEAKQRELSKLREQASAPNLWEDPDRARKVMRRMAEVESDLGEVERLSRQLSDLETLNELAQEEDDEASPAEVEQGIASLSREMEDLEVLALLGGEYDDRDAIATIHPGAGGTESQDWAEILSKRVPRCAETRGVTV